VDDGWSVKACPALMRQVARASFEMIAIVDVDAVGDELPLAVVIVASSSPMYFALAVLDGRVLKAA
jgi:hypothetical protein